MCELGTWRLNYEAYNDFFYFVLCYVELLCGHFFPKGFEIKCWSKLPATHIPWRFLTLLPALLGFVEDAHQILPFQVHCPLVNNF
jgi:hypothetical protein